MADIQDRVVARFRAAAQGKFPAVLNDIEDDFRRRAITRGERDELRRDVEKARSETEAWRIVDQHRKSR